MCALFVFPCVILGWNIVLESRGLGERKVDQKMVLKKVKAAMDVLMVLMGGDGANGGGGGADGGGGGADASEGGDNGMLLPSYSAGKFRSQCSEQRC
jgi:hypothetical protein